MSTAYTVLHDKVKHFSITDNTHIGYCNWKEKEYLCLEERLQDMKYKDFENIISPERMRKYNVACGGNRVKAMTGSET